MTTTRRRGNTRTNRSEHKPQQKIAKIAGFAWLVIIAAGIYAEVFLRARLIVPDDAAATATNIAASEGLFRLSVASDFVMLVADVVVALALYMLLRPINEGLALLASFFRLVQAAILGVNLLNLSFVLLMLGGAGALAAFTSEQLHAFVLVALEAQAIGYDIGLVFFAFALALLGYLLFRSRYVPRPLAVLLALSAPVYLTGSLVTVLAPEYSPMLEPAYLLPFVAESSLALWLLVKGVNPQDDTSKT